MSERWPRIGSRQPTAESQASAPPSSNGAEPGDVVGTSDKRAEEPIVASDKRAEEPIVASDKPAEEPIVASDKRAEEPIVASDKRAEEPIVASDKRAEEQIVASDKSADESTTDPVTAGVTSTPAGEGAPGNDGSETAMAEPPPTADDGSLFLAELVRAMRTTAGLERARIGEDTERRRQDQINQVRARQASEADRMRELAGEDKKAIESWADGETKRIQVERERREKELNADLEMSLAGHRAKVDREIEGVEAAIATYQAEVDAFFEALDRETDPVLIAQQAARRPVFPTLEAVAETPSSPEPAVVGVMDAEALAARIGSWPNASVTNGEGTDAVASAAGPDSASRGTLLETVPAARPMSWLRRGGNGGDDGPSRDS